MAAESEALIQVRATALNFGEVHFIDRMRKPGEVPGWDAAGVVVQAAADGSGPPVGSRVVGFHGAGGWAERRAVPTENLAVLPDSVDFGPGGGTPGGRGDRAAGAARARPGGRPTGADHRRVRRGRSIRGATGGAGGCPRDRSGRFGRSRCRVEGAGRDGGRGRAGRRRRAGVRCAGQRRRAAARRGIQPCSPTAAQLQSIGMASNQPSTIDFEVERRVGVRKRLEPFTVRTPFGRDLAYLVELLAAGESIRRSGCGRRGTMYPKRLRRCSTAGSRARRYWTWRDG